MLVWLKRLKASPSNWSLYRSRNVNCRPIRKSTFLYPGPVIELRSIHGARPPIAPPELLTVPPVKPPSTPPDGKPLIPEVTGWPVDTVTMVENAQPFSSRRVGALETFANDGIHTALATNRWRWSRSERAYSSFRFIGSTGESVP